MFIKDKFIKDMVITSLGLTILCYIVAKIFNFKTENSLYAIICMPILTLPLYIAGITFCKKNKSKKGLCYFIKFLMGFAALVYIVCLFSVPLSA